MSEAFRRVLRTLRRDHDMATIPEPFDIDECNRRCHNAMLNTPVGKWLAAACREIEALRKQLEKPKGEGARKSRTCPECKAITDGGIHDNAGGTLCPMIYGRRGWRQLGEYDT